MWLFTDNNGVHFLTNFHPALHGRRGQNQGVPLAGAVTEVLRVSSHRQMLVLVQVMVCKADIKVFFCFKTDMIALPILFN